jgi:hypothetical protein
VPDIVEWIIEQDKRVGYVRPRKLRDALPIQVANRIRKFNLQGSIIGSGCPNYIGPGRLAFTARGSGVVGASGFAYRVGCEARETGAPTRWTQTV